MMRKKKGQNAGIESKPNSNILSSVRKLFEPAKARAKHGTDEASDAHPDVSATPLSKDDGATLPVREEEITLPDKPPVSGTSLTENSHTLVPQASATISVFSQNQHQDTTEPSSQAAVSLFLAVSQDASAHQNSEHIKPPPSTDDSSVSVPDSHASSQQSSTISGQKRPSSNTSTDQANAPAPKTVPKSSAFRRKGLAVLKIIGETAGVSTESMENDMSRNQTARKYCNDVAEWIKALVASNVPQAMKVGLENLRSDIDRMAKESDIDVEGAWRVTNRLQIFVLENIVTLPKVFEKIEEKLSTIVGKEKDYASHQTVMYLPCAKAAYNDYTSKNQERVSCFEGTRLALLKEIIEWAAESVSNVYVLSGLAGIGKSTIAQTVAEKADKIGLLGASFFFSKDEEERRKAEMFFTTIAFQLCIYDPEFATTIEHVLLTEKGKGAMTKAPLEQLETLILEPLQSLAPRKVVIVVDALDECDKDDGPIVLKGLHKLVQTLPSFRVILTTRPQQRFQLLLDDNGPHKVFHLHRIEDKVVDNDIRRYLKHKLSREAVRDRFQDPEEQWSASDAEIESLVKAAGRLFIIASLSVRFILDEAAQDPKFRMQRLLNAIARDETTLLDAKVPDKLYKAMLESAVPPDSDSYTKQRYQNVVGAIMLIRTPLSVDTLAKLIRTNPEDIRRVLGKLQPVILIDGSVPRIYHRSFRDYIQDLARCKNKDLYVDPKSHNTRIALHCLKTMAQHLKQNVLELGNPARFLDNDEALEKQGLTENHKQRKIPSELRYACLYFAKHLESADIYDVELAMKLKVFIDKQLLYWIEALSWIRRLFSAYHVLVILQKLLRPSSSDLRQLVADMLRFVAKFYTHIKRSALYIYHSALPFTPTETSLHKTYSKQMMFCRVEGGPKKWGALVAQQDSISPNPANHITFSPDSTLFACYINEVGSESGLATIHDASSAVPIRWVEGQLFTIANDLSKVATFGAGFISLFDVEGAKHVVSIRSPAAVVNVGLFPDRSRLVAGLDDGTISLLNTEKLELIESFDGWHRRGGIAFSSDGNRIAFASQDVVTLFDGTSGEVIVDLPLLGQEVSRLLFSANGTRLVYLSNSTLQVWKSQGGVISVGTAEYGNLLAISVDGSLLARGTLGATGTLGKLNIWHGDDLSHTETLDIGTQVGFETLDLETLDLESPAWSLAIHNDILGIAVFYHSVVILYDVNKHAFIARLPFFAPTTLAFSPDCTRLAVGNIYSEVQLWDVESIATSNVTPQGHARTPTKLVLSSDYSRIASVHQNGTISLWDTSNITNPVSVRECDTKPITAFAFSVDDGKFASASEEGIIRLWNGQANCPDASSTQQCAGNPIALALSSNILAAATETSITLWVLGTVAIVTLPQGGTKLMTFPNQDHLLAIAADATGSQHSLILWDIQRCARTATVDLSKGTIKSMALAPDRPDHSRLAILYYDNIQLFNIQTNKVSESQGISWFGFRSRGDRIPLLGTQAGIVGVFPEQRDGVTVLHFPNDLDVAMVVEGSSLIAIGCTDGRILLVKEAA